MGNIIASEKITVNIKKRIFKVIKMHIPYDQLAMIRVLQKEFNYEVKGTIYVDHEYQFKSFEVRTDNSEIFSYGASDWRISFHTHPDKTAQKYGIRYFSPPSVDDVLEIYDHSLAFVPENTQSGFGEISIIFANEGIYILQVNRDSFIKFNEENLPIEGLEEVLNGTLTDFLVTKVKKGITEIIEPESKPDPNPESKPESNPKSKPDPNPKSKLDVKFSNSDSEAKPKSKINFDNPDISVEQYTKVVKDLSRQVSELYGFDMTFYSWPELEKDGLTLNVYDYYLNKKVLD